jgi:hypothetical protein
MREIFWGCVLCFLLGVLGKLGVRRGVFVVWVWWIGWERWFVGWWFLRAEFFADFWDLFLRERKVVRA